MPGDLFRKKFWRHSINGKGKGFREKLYYSKPCLVYMQCYAMLLHATAVHVHGLYNIASTGTVCTDIAQRAQGSTICVLWNSMCVMYSQIINQHTCEVLNIDAVLYSTACICLHTQSLCVIITHLIRQLSSGIIQQHEIQETDRQAVN